MGRGSRRSARSGHAAGGPWDCRGERRRATAGPNRGAGTRGAACLTDDGADCIGGAGTMTEARSEQASQQLRVDEPAGSAGPRGCPSPEWQMGLRTPGTKERASMWDPVDKPCPTPASINNGIMSPVRPRRTPDVADDCMRDQQRDQVKRNPLDPACQPSRRGAGRPKSLAISSSSDSRLSTPLVGATDGWPASCRGAAGSAEPRITRGSGSTAGPAV